MTQTPTLSIIAALSQQTRAIGNKGELLWHLPGDLPRLKEITMGHPLIMGSKTFQSIGRPLPGRTNIVVTFDKAWAHEDLIAVHSIEEALRAARETGTDEIFVFGGGTIYQQTIDLADRLYLTLVNDPKGGDTFFPEYEHLMFTEVSREEHDHEGLGYAYVVLERT